MHVRQSTCIIANLLDAMYFRDDAYSAPIETVNAQCIGVYRTKVSAVAAANRHADDILEGGTCSVDRDDETGMNGRR